MAFTIANWTCISSSLSQGQEIVTPFMGSTTVGNAPNLFMYGSPNDSTTTIAAANYFLPQYNSLSAGDWIMGFGTDAPFIYQVIASSSTSVTVLTFANPTINYTWTNYTPSYNGFSGTPTTQIASYLQIGKICFVQLAVLGTSNSTNFTFSLPITPATLSNYAAFPVGNAINNSVNQDNVGGLIVEVFMDMFINGGGNWSASGTKGASMQFFYQTV